MQLFRQHSQSRSSGSFGGVRKRVRKDVRDTEFGRTDFKINRSKEVNKNRRREDDKKKFQNEQRYKRSFSKQGQGRKFSQNTRSLSKSQNKQRLIRNNPNFIDLKKPGVGIQKSQQIDIQETFNIFEQKLQSLANRNQVFTKSGASEALEKAEALNDVEKLQAEKKIQSSIRKQTLQLNNILGHESSEEIHKFLGQSMKFGNKQDIMRTFSQNLSMFDEMNDYLRAKMRQPYDIHKGELKYMNYAPKYKNFAMVTSFLLKLKKQGIKVFRPAIVKQN